MSRKLMCFVLLISTCGILSACGQAGKLYLPPQPPQPVKVTS